MTTLTFRDARQRRLDRIAGYKSCRPDENASLAQRALARRELERVAKANVEDLINAKPKSNLTSEDLCAVSVASVLGNKKHYSVDAIAKANADALLLIRLSMNGWNVLEHACKILEVDSSFLFELELSAPETCKREAIIRKNVESVLAEPAQNDATPKETAMAGNPQETGVETKENADEQNSAIALEKEEKARSRRLQAVLTKLKEYGIESLEPAEWAFFRGYFNDAGGPTPGARALIGNTEPQTEVQCMLPVPVTDERNAIVVYAHQGIGSIVKTLTAQCTALTEANVTTLVLKDGVPPGAVTAINMAMLDIVSQFDKMPHSHSMRALALELLESAPEWMLDKKIYVLAYQAKEILQEVFGEPDENGKGHKVSLPDAYRVLGALRFELSEVQSFAEFVLEDPDAITRATVHTEYSEDNTQQIYILVSDLLTSYLKYGRVPADIQLEARTLSTINLQEYREHKWAKGERQDPSYPTEDTEENESG